MAGKKRTGFAYFFAFIGGVFGLHHLYLGRTQHACLWFTTFGGFGFGLLYELLFLLREYVREANGDPSTVDHYRVKMQQRRSPAFETMRFCGQYATAVFYGFITYYAFPETWVQGKITSIVIALCSTIAIALGVQMTGTLGPRRCSFVWPFLGALLGMPFLLWYSEGSPGFNIATFLSCWIFEWKVDWNPDYFPPTTSSSVPPASPRSSSPKASVMQRRHIIKRCLILGVGALVFSGLLSSAIYQNLHVDINGERVKIKDVLTDYFKSQEFIDFYQQLSALMRQLWAFYSHSGFRGIWTQIWSALDLESEKKAFEILQINSKASQKEIEMQCRKLSRQWHPDRYRDPVEKQKAETTFMNIQQACNRLSNERKKRQSINEQRRENPI